MARSFVCEKALLAGCAWLLASSASAKPWWQDPVRKYSENTGIAYSFADPHYMNKDESDQYLYMGMSSGGGTAFLYSIPALIAGTSSNDVAPIATNYCSNTAVWGSWKGGAVSDDLKIAVTGNGNAGNSVRTTFPLSAPWTTNVTVFASTNSPSNLAMDGCDFSHDSKVLYSDVYTGGLSSNLVTWSVSYTPGQGIQLTQANTFMTSCRRFRNVSDYYIGGKDLVFYGEGDDTLGVKPRNAYVYDPALGTETLLVSLNRTNEAGVAGADLDIMNAKVGGVGLGQMHLYLQCNDGAIFIYDLAADGKSVGALVKSISKTELKAILGVDNPRIRNIEFTNDEKYCFIVHKPINDAAGKALLHVLWAAPTVETAWWHKPYVKVKEDVVASSPRAMNMDESGQYLFLPSGISSSSSGYLYNIPALTAAATSNDVGPIASGKPAATFQPGAVIYYQDFDGIEAADTAAVTNAIKWEICQDFTKHSARYSIRNGKLITDNLDETHGYLTTDSYAIVKSSDFMKTYCTNDYSYQYDVTYRNASTNNFRYVSLLCNYTRTNVYNTVDVRIRGEGYNQARHKNNTWDLYNTGSWPLNATGTNSMMYLLYGVPYNTPANNSVPYYNYTNITLTVRVEMSMSNGPSVYVNGLLVSKMDKNQGNWSEKDQANWNAYAIAFKTSTKVLAEIDNIMVWQGCGVEPVWKGGAISDQNMRLLTANSGAANASLPLIGDWTNAAAVVSITNNPAMVTAYMDAMDFGHNFGSTQYLYSYSDYFTRTNDVTAQQGYQHKIYQWSVTNFTGSGFGFASKAVFTTCLTQLRNLDAYCIGGKDLVYYGEGQVGLAGKTRVCVLDPATSSETVLIDVSTNAIPSNVMNVKVGGIGHSQMHLYVQCDSGALYVYELGADGKSVGALLRAFTPAQIKALLGGASFAHMRSFEVTNDEKDAFFTYDDADGLYVVGSLPVKATLMTVK